MREFNNAFKESIAKCRSTLMIVKIMEKYVLHQWPEPNIYNSLIEAYGNKFKDFSILEMVKFCECLSLIGLR